MSDFTLSVLCLVVTLGLYFANKRLYRRFHKLPLMPLVLTPVLLVLILVFGHISYQSYMGESHWLLWLLGPATIAFAVPVYDNMAIIKRHWMSLTAGVVTASVVAVTTSVWLARLFTLSHGDWRRSVLTPVDQRRNGERGWVRRSVARRRDCPLLRTRPAGGRGRQPGNDALRRGNGSGGAASTLGNILIFSSFTSKCSR